MAGTVSTWLGLSDRAEEGVYAAADGGEPASADGPFWATDEPNDPTSLSDCVQLRAETVAWDDAGCERQKAVICQV